MGMYTELYLGVRFKENLPSDVLTALRKLVAGGRQGGPWPNHPFFKCSRFWHCFHGNSYYFDANPICRFEWDNISNCFCLTFVANIKNYEKEWQHFLDWIGPYLDTKGHIGHYRYEEDDMPTILVAEDDGSISWVNSFGNRVKEML